MARIFEDFFSLLNHNTAYFELYLVCISWFTNCFYSKIQC